MSDQIPTDDDIARRVLRNVMLLSVAFLVVVVAVDVSTQITDAERAGVALSLSSIWVDELTSIAVIIALIPAVALIERRYQVMAGPWHVVLLAHLAGWMAFSLVHYVGITALRWVVIELVGGATFDFGVNPVDDMLYEMRKDSLTYATILLLLTFGRAIAERDREMLVANVDAKRHRRLTLKSGGRTLWLDADSFFWATAAGNYVEINCQGGTHLVRATLRNLEEQLREARIPVAQVHRSILVNTDKIVGQRPTDDGDFYLTTSTGDEIRGSRRYKERLADLGSELTAPRAGSRRPSA